MQNNIVIGSRLDKNKKVIPNTGVSITKESKTAQLISTIKDPLVIANPITKEVLIGMHLSKESAKGLVILPPGGSGPPIHIHPTYDEIFEVIDGRFEFYKTGKKVELQLGEKITVEAGIAHTFKPLGNTFSAFIGEASPAGKISEVIKTIYGLAIEGKLDAKGRPGFLQGIALGKELQDDTLFTSPPPGIQKFLFKLLGNSAKKKGYKAIYPHYANDEFWRAHIDQVINL